MVAEVTPFRIVRTTTDLAEAVRSAEVITSISVQRHKWRVPSPVLLTDLLGHRRHLLEEQDWLIEPAKYEEVRASVEEDIHQVEEQLAQMTPPRANRLKLWHIARGQIVFSPADQVVTASGASSLYELGKVLEPHGQCLPFPPQGTHFFASKGGSLRDLIDFNMPHALEAQCGSWRDWILGMTVVLADGRIVKAGSHAVKNVAGYDVHKLMVGARGTLGIIAEVILRTFPIAALPEPEIQLNYERKALREMLPLYSRPRWIQRTASSDFREAVAGVGEHLLEADWASSTLCAQVDPDEELPRYPGDWVIRSRAGGRNLQFTDPTQIRMMKRAKEIFDPTGKLNPGEMGIF